MLGSAMLIQSIRIEEPVPTDAIATNNIALEGTEVMNFFHVLRILGLGVERPSGFLYSLREV